jgi:hypothetical protein
MTDKTVSERTHDGTMKVMILERDEGQGSSFAIEYGNKWINLGNPRATYPSAKDAQEAADLAVDLTGHRCYWACSAWT